MKKIKKLFLKFFVFISLFMFSTKVKANTINSIEMDVYIDKNGHAEIVETWNAYLNQGTEGYRPYTNMGNSNISNFIVTDETGITYENLSNWNTSASFNDKAYKSGINYISNGLELCWGISKYGNKTYTLKYNINNFVTQYTDAQGIYFNFINLDQYVGNAKITIHSDYAFSLDNARIWAFGNNGTINFENGNIVLNSNGSLNEEQYMVALIRFETNLFSTSNKSTLSFDDVYDSAMKGVINWNNIIKIIITLIIVLIIILIFIKKKNKKHNKNILLNEKKERNKNNFIGVLKYMFFMICLVIFMFFIPVFSWTTWAFIFRKINDVEKYLSGFVFVILIIIIALSVILFKKMLNSLHNNRYEKNNLTSFKRVIYILGLFLIIFNPLFFFVVLYLIIEKKDIHLKINSNNKQDLDFGVHGKTLPYDADINYFRDIPCNKDLERTYWVALQYNVVPNSTLYPGIIGAILLKWIKEEKIKVIKTKQASFNSKDNNYAIDFSNLVEISNPIENALLQILKLSAGDNNLLETKEFEKWCKTYYGAIQNWFYSFDIIEQEELEKQGLIISTKEKKTGLLGYKVETSIKKVQPQLREDAIQLKGLKKFLLEFSMMPEKNYYEVHIWEEYLIFATLLGIADKVEEQFSKLYPKFREETKLNLDVTASIIRDISNSSYEAYRTGKRNLTYENSTRYRSHDYSGRSRSSGGGGSSFSSGGSSSGGSSGGGFR